MNEEHLKRVQEVAAELNGCVIDLESHDIWAGFVDLVVRVNVVRDAMKVASIRLGWTVALGWLGLATSEKIGHAPVWLDLVLIGMMAAVTVGTLAQHVNWKLQLDRSVRQMKAGAKRVLAVVERARGLTQQLEALTRGPKFSLDETTSQQLEHARVKLHGMESFLDHIMRLEVPEQPEPAANAD